MQRVGVGEVQGADFSLAWRRRDFIERHGNPVAAYVPRDAEDRAVGAAFARSSPNMPIVVRASLARCSAAARVFVVGTS